ncbi:MAG TPA: hypothetical protein VKB92_00015 [Myxococcales bacterium]|nr:hypothetical protein [Myxococcales bacterium]
MKKAIVSFALALAACAGARSVQSQDPLPGHWVGVIDRDGWQRQLSVMIDRSEGSYRGSWMSLESQPGIMLDGVRRSSDEVHIELAALVFDGRIAGRTLAGTVTNKAGSSVGSFTLTRLDPAAFRETSGP